MDGVKEEEYGYMNVVIKVMSMYVSLCGKESCMRWIKVLVDICIVVHSFPFPKLNET